MPTQTIKRSGIKRCIKCGETKATELFSRQRHSKDGRRGCCKSCQATQTREWQLANPEREAERVRRWKEQNSERKAALDRRWEETHRDRVAERHKKDRQRYPEKHRARSALNHAVRDGRITKPECCEDCAEPTTSRDLHGHRKDYSKPLEVEWLCRDCHLDQHRPTRNGAGRGVK